MTPETKEKIQENLKKIIELVKKGAESIVGFTKVYGPKLKETVKEQAISLKKNTTLLKGKLEMKFKKEVKTKPDDQKTKKNNNTPKKPS